MDYHLFVIGCLCGIIIVKNPHIQIKSLQIMQKHCCLQVVRKLMSLSIMSPLYIKAATVVGDTNDVTATLVAIPHAADKFEFSIKLCIISIIPLRYTNKHTPELNRIVGPHC